MKIKVEYYIRQSTLKSLAWTYYISSVMRKELDTSSTTKSILIHIQPSAGLLAIYLPDKTHLQDHDTPCKEEGKWDGSDYVGLWRWETKDRMCSYVWRQVIVHLLWWPDLYWTHKPGEEYKCEEMTEWYGGKSSARQQTQQIETKIQTCAFASLYEPGVKLKCN